MWAVVEHSQGNDQPAAARSKRPDDASTLGDDSTRGDDWTLGDGATTKTPRSAQALAATGIESDLARNFRSGENASQRRGNSGGTRDQGQGTSDEESEFREITRSLAA